MFLTIFLLLAILKRNKQEPPVNRKTCIGWSKGVGDRIDSLFIKNFRCNLLFFASSDTILMKNGTVYEESGWLVGV